MRKRKASEKGVGAGKGHRQVKEQVEPGVEGDVGEARKAGQEIGLCGSRMTEDVNFPINEET